MNFQQLESFLWIARLQSFSLAAQKVNATQSTVSTRLAELEKELGIQLFERSRRSVRLTPKGRDLLRYADELLHLHAEVKDHVGNPNTVSGTLRIGAAELVALTWLPDLFRAIKTTYPRVGVELQVGLGGELLNHLHSGDLDVVLMPLADTVVPGIKTQQLGAVEFGFMAGPNLQLPKGILGREQILSAPVITHGHGSVLHGILQSWFEAGGATLERSLTSSSMEAASKLAEADLGSTFLPLFYYKEAIKQGRLRHVKVRPALPRIRFVAAHPHGRIAPLTEAIVKLSLSCSTFAQRNPR